MFPIFLRNLLPGLFIFIAFCSMGNYCEGLQALEVPKYQGNRYFIVDTAHRLIPYSGEIAVRFAYELNGVTEAVFRVRPYVYSGMVSIWDPEKNYWVAGTAPWTAMPVLNEEVMIKVEGLLAPGTKVYFQVQDIRKGSVYATNELTIWGRQEYRDYIRRLNANIVDPGLSLENSDKIP